MNDEIEDDSEKNNRQFHESDHTEELLRFLDEAIQCVRPVAYLHQLQPPRCHRDIKSLNYLVSSHVAPHRKLAGLGPEIKLADMETVSIVRDDEEDENGDDDDYGDDDDEEKGGEVGERGGGSRRRLPPVAFTPQ
jgi:hypothetical protein